jgi:hypothetical protein
MQIINGENPQNIYPPRKKFQDTVNPPKALKPRRIKIIEASAIRGVPVYPGSVFEFDIARIDNDCGYDDWAALINSLKAVRVKITEPLITLPAPAPATPVETPNPIAGLAAELILQIQARPKSKGAA